MTKSSRFRHILSFFILLFSLFICVSCDEIAPVVRQHTVTFDTMGGEEMRPQIVNSGGVVRRPVDNPVREGAVFITWYADRNLRNMYDFKEPVKSDITLYAGWNIARHTVSFKTNYSGFVADQMVDHGGTAREPTILRVGHTLENWYQDVQFQEVYDFSTPVTASIILYAKWSTNYTVIFNTDGGSGISPQSIPIEPGVKVARPEPDPTRSGCTFEGWFTDTTFATPYDFDTELTGNITIHVKWGIVVPLTHTSNVGLYLSYQTGGEAAASPIDLPMNVPLTADNWTSLCYAIYLSEKYVNLDLNLCAHSGSASGTGLRTNGVFDLDSNTSFGKSQIVNLILPETTVRLTASDGLAFHFFTSVQTVEGPNVTTIEPYSFQGCVALTGVTMPEVASIGEFAFMACSSLGTVNFPRITAIGDYAFKNSGVNNLTFGAVTTIGKESFQDCTRLTSINLSTVTSIGDSAFQGCTALTGVTFANAATIGEGVFKGCVRLNSVNMARLTRIPPYTFQSCALLRNVEFASVNEIGDMAFNNCAALAAAKFPVARTIGFSAFQGCTALTVISLSNSSNASSFPEVTTIGEMAFRDCTGLTDTTFPRARDIGYGAFQGAFNKGNITAPNVVHIEANAFAYSTVRTADFGATNTAKTGSYIGERAFQQTASLETVTFTGVVAIYKGAFINSRITNATFPQVEILGAVDYGGFRSDDDTVFQNCASLTSASFAKLNYLYPANFTGCTSLATLNFPMVPAIPNNAFQNRTSLTTVNFAAAITIGNNAFQGCTRLKTVTFTAAQTIGNNAFQNCTSLPAVDFPNATRINQYAFDGCTALLSLATSFPKVTILNDYAFRGCTKLGVVNFPLLTYISDYAFQNCSSLYYLTFPEVTSIGSNSFENCTSIHNLPRLTSGGGSGVCPFPKIERIGYYAFAGCTRLENIWFPGDTILQYAFSGCTSLRSALLPNTLFINEYAFSGCTSLRTVVAYNVMKLGGRSWDSILANADNSRVFANTGDTELTIYFPDYAPIVAKQTFYGVTSKKQVNIMLRPNTTKYNPKFYGSEGTGTNTMSACGHGENGQYNHYQRDETWENVNGETVRTQDGFYHSRYHLDDYWPQTGIRDLGAPNQWGDEYYNWGNSFRGRGYYSHNTLSYRDPVYTGTDNSNTNIWLDIYNIPTALWDSRMQGMFSSFYSMDPP